MGLIGILGWSAASSHSRRSACAVLFSAVICSTPVATQASPIGLRFSGTVDLSVFGAPADSTVEGSVTWEPGRACGPGGGGEGDFPLSPLDDDPPCVTATLWINSISYNGFDLEGSRLMLFGDGMVLQLWWFDPHLDLDGGAAPDVLLMELELWRRFDSENPVFSDIGELPRDLSFLTRLRDRSLVFLSPGCLELEEECVHSSAVTLRVVPEPSSATLLLLAFSAGGIWARSRRRTRSRSPTPR